MNFNIISIYINGLNDHRKRTAFINWLHFMKVDVVCLQETHAPSHESIRWWFNNTGFHAASSCFTNKSGSTAILVKDTYKIDKIIRDDDGRFVQALVSLGDESLSFISLYAPNKNPACNTFFTSLTGLIDPIIAGPGVWKFNTSLLQDPEYVSLVKSFWSFWDTYKDHEDFASLLDWWDQGKFYLREVTRSYSKSKAAQQCSKKASLLKRMREFQALFEAGDQASFAVLCQVQQELRRIALHEARGAQVRACCQWAEEGETSSSFFLNLATKKHAKQVMQSIRDPNTGEVCYDPFAIVGVWQAYYKDIYIHCYTV